MSPIHINPHSDHWQRRTLVSAIAAALSPAWTNSSYAQNQNSSQDDWLEEVIVTARKRNENIQDIPQSIQAFSAADIARIGIRGLADIGKFVPSMTVVGAASGLNKIVFRGLADSVFPFIADSSAAIYLDEQPLTQGAQSPEIRPIDLERIEALAGPQGTLYGASSQSGTLRYIVAKPDSSQFDANAGGGISSVSSGGTGWDADVMLNIPLLEDKLAIRLVGFSARDAGYIDNVLGTTPGRIDANTGERIAGNQTNVSIVDDNFNSADWKGGRASIKWLVNDAWALTGIYNYSDSTINGFNDYDPRTGDLKTIKFQEEFWDDKWSNVQFTLDADFTAVKLSSSTAYFERDIAYLFDATNNVAYYHSILGSYGRGSCGSNPYYAAYNLYDYATACELNGTGYDADDGDPTGSFRLNQTDERWTHETRLGGSTSRWDWTMGFFYQEARQSWAGGSYLDNYTRTESWAAFNTIYGELAPTDNRNITSQKSKHKDKSIFGEATLSLTERWKLLLGARWYESEIDRTFAGSSPATAPPAVFTPSGKDDGVLPKLGFQYFFKDNRMFYALYSEGFRLGGANRTRSNRPPALPIQYDSDLLKNYEMGLKSRWIDGRLQFNATAYHQLWHNMQLELTDPATFFTVIANVGDAVVDGLDVDISFLPTDRLSLGLVGTYLFKAEIDEDIAVLDERDPDNIALAIPVGTRLPLTADLNISAYAEYAWKVAGGDAYLRLQYGYTGSSFNRLLDRDGDPAGTGYGGRVEQASYQLWDLRTGFTNSNWEFSLYVDNLGDERAVVHRNTGAAVFWGHEQIRILKPRTFGVNFRRYFD